MAFIRSYSQRGQLAAMGGDFGDPGFFKKLKKRVRLPKAIRKFQPGKALAKIAPLAASFIPGVGPLAALAAIAQRTGVPLDVVQQLAGFSADQGDAWTSDGWDYGDPGKKAPKRKRAAAGTKTKAKNKGKGGKKGPGRRPSGSRQGVDWAKLGEAAAGSIPIAGGVASEVLRQINEARAGAGGGLDLGAASATLGGMKLPKGARGFGGGGHRRQNPTNVKALRRSIRRVEGFRHLVKRVEKAFPALRSHPRAPIARKKGRR